MCLQLCTFPKKLQKFTLCWFFKNINKTYYDRITWPENKKKKLEKAINIRRALEMWWYNILDNYCNFVLFFSSSLLSRFNFCIVVCLQQFSRKNKLFVLQKSSGHNNKMKEGMGIRKVVIFTSLFNKFIRCSCVFCVLLILKLLH